jgi:hypothetical protein
MAPPEERYPFHGKMTAPTAVPSATERLKNLNQKDKAKRRRRFLAALLAGQIFVLLLDIGGEAVLHLLRNKLQYRGAFPLRSMVFLGMTSMIAAIGLLVFLVLGYKGASRVLGGGQRIGFFTALGVGIRRVWNEAWALGLILGVIGGTAWFLIPAAGRDDLKAKGREVVEKSGTWIKEKVTPKASTPAAPSKR